MQMCDLSKMRRQTTPRSLVRIKPQKTMGRKVDQSLSPPCLACKAVSGNVRNLEAFGDFRLYENGCPLIALVGVLFIHSSMVFLRIVAALENHREELSKLAKRISRVVNMGLRLDSVRM